MTTIDQMIDAITTPRSAAATKALHQRHPDWPLRDVRDDAEAVLLALDEHDSGHAQADPPEAELRRLRDAIRHVVHMAHHGTEFALLIHAVIELRQHLPETERQP